MGSGLPAPPFTRWHWLRSAVLWGAVAVVAVVLLLLDFRVDQQRVRIARLVASDFPADWLDRDTQPEALFDRLLPQFERRAMARSSAVRRICVSRLHRGEESLIYPDDLRNKDWPRILLPSCQRVPVGNGREVLGYLYIELDPRMTQRLHWLLRGTLLAVVLSGLGLFLFLRRQARTLESTSVELAERTQELYHLERLALVGRLTASILHDLKKPMLHIRDEAGGIADAQQRMAILEQVGLFFDLLRELDLEGFLSRSEERAEFVDLEDIVRRSYRLVERQGRGVSFSAAFPEEPILLLAIKHRLVQVFSNLFLNALQAMPGGGKIEVTCRVEPVEGGQQARIDVRDTGPGIPTDRLNAIFEPFRTYSAAAGSAGLGLYITRCLVRDLDGEITVESHEGEGTTFTLLLPLEEPPVRGEPVETTAVQPARPTLVP